METNNGIPNGFKVTEIGPLPKEWKVVKLGEITTIRGGKRLPKGHRFSDRVTPFPYVRIVDFMGRSIKLTDLKYLRLEDRETLKRYVITSDDVYISIAGTIGLVGTVPPELDGANLTENAARLIINDKSEMEKYFLVVFLDSEIGRKEIDLRTTKTSQPKLALSRIRQIPVPVPPFLEQKRIAFVLSIVQQAVEKIEAIINSTKELKKSMMKHLFTYGPVPVDEAEDVVLKETEVGLVPEEWEIAKLGELCFQRKESIEPEDASGIYIGLEHIIPGELRIERWGEPINVRSTKHVFYRGDILYGKLRPYLNKVATANEDGICSTDIIVLKVFEEKILQDYLANFMHTKIFLNHAIMTMSGVNHPRTSWTKLRNFKMPLPSLCEQQKIISILSSLGQKIQAEQSKKEALEQLFRTLLHNLMTGTIRVSHLEVPHD